jgi:hypothetical protein
MPICGHCVTAYLFAGLYAVNSGGDRRLTYAIRIEGRAKRRLGGQDTQHPWQYRRVQIVQLCRHRRLRRLCQSACLLPRPVRPIRNSCGLFGGGQVAAKASSSSLAPGESRGLFRRKNQRATVFVGRAIGGAAGPAGSSRRRSRRMPAGDRRVWRSGDHGGHGAGDNASAADPEREGRDCRNCPGYCLLASTASWSTG